jgi:phosphatidylglycerophosphate synthase
MVEQAVILTDRFAPPGSGAPGDPCRVLLGLGLLQRMILTLAHGGIKRILLLGREAGTARLALPGDDGEARRSGIVLESAAAEARAALPLARAPFLLLNGALVFTVALARWIHDLKADGNCLLVPDGMAAPAGADSSLLSSGLAVCRAAMFPRALDLRGDDACPGEPTAVLHVHGHSWVRLDSPPAEKQARHLLRRSLGKPSDGFFSQHLNRHISWPISRLLIRLEVRPNQVTVANLALGLFSGWLIGRGGYGSTLAAGLLFQFVSIFDGCDGEIARLTFRFSAFGAKLDNLCDFVTLVVFFLNLPIGIYAATANMFYLALGALMALVVAVFYLLLLARIKLSGHRGNIAEIARQVQDKGKIGRPLSGMERLGTRLGFIYRKEFISLYAMVWCVFDRAEVFLSTTLALTSLGIVYEVYHLGQLWRQPRRSDDKV